MREKQIVKVSILGIVVNIILVIFKGIIGLITNSIAIILDAVNNLSDALSSVITIVGTFLAGKKPDKKHPFGYGRIEYFSSVIIALIVLIAGLSAFKESFSDIINPTKSNYSIISLIIIVVAVLVKFFFGMYVKKEGVKFNSNSLIASGTDAISDSFLSASTLLAAIISLLFNISLEGYLGVIISLFILKSAIEILKDTINDMIGIRVDSSLSKELKQTILSNEGVLGVYDLTFHSYGPNKIIATAHIGVDDDMKALIIHRLTRKITVEVYEKYGIILTIGIYASNDKGKYKEIKKYLNDIIKEYKTIIEVHGFYVDEESSNISFDLIFDFKEREIEKIIEEIKDKLTTKYPEYSYSVIIDTDFSD